MLQGLLKAVEEALARHDKPDIVNSDQGVPVHIHRLHGGIEEG